MRGPKILAVASAVDLDFRYGCTPAWWQLWKGLHEEGVDLVVTPYRGRPVESPWWRTAPNPTYVEGESFARARDAFARLKGDTMLRRAEDNPETGYGDRMTRELIWRWVTPRWRRHLERLVEAERPDAVVVFTVPMSHLRGIPSALRERFGVPVLFYDGDVPMSLPEFGGMDTGFNWYHDADPSEYDAVLSNSEGGLERLRRARRAARRTPSSGAPTPSSSPRRTSTRRQTSSSTATATSSGATGWTRWSASRRGACRTSTSRSAGETFAATRATPGWSATSRSTSSRGRSRLRASTSA